MIPQTYTATSEPWRSYAFLFFLVFLFYTFLWLACWTQAQKGLGSNRSRDAVG